MSNEYSAYIALIGFLSLIFTLATFLYWFVNRMVSEPTALGALIGFLLASVVLAPYLYFFVNPIWVFIIIIIWVLLFISILAYDSRHWGQPNQDTLGVNLSSQTRKLPQGTYKVEAMVMGTCVKTRNMFSSARAEARSLIGGEARQFTQLVNECRNTALTRMCQKAKDMDCNWVVGFRMITAETMWGATEIIAYGTAVRIK